MEKGYIPNRGSQGRYSGGGSIALPPEAVEVGLGWITGFGQRTAREVRDAANLFLDNLRNINESLVTRID